MRIIIDSAIPYIQGVLEPYFDVVYKQGDEIGHDDVANCCAMFIRTRTHCNKELLEGSKVKFIGTATIGTDHVDLEYCKQNGIGVFNAAGCNAMAVAHWVVAAIVEYSKTNTVVPAKTTIGVVGVGNVGTVIADMFEKMDFIVLRNDPPRARKDKTFCSVSLEDLLERSDFLTFHTPLTTTGDFPTYHMLNSGNIGLLKESVIVLNASRGGVIDEIILLEAYRNNKIASMMIDVWECEPNINIELLNDAKVTTAHIAGYSQQGKANATAMIVNEISNMFGITELVNWYPIHINRLESVVEISWANIKRLMPLYYDIISDSKMLKAHSEQFESLRNNYKYRKEFF